MAVLLFISNALAQTTPVVLTQPQGQTAIVGSNVTFWVTVADGSAPPPLPSVSSGTLQLWLKADAGVVTNSAGLVSQWQDQSGNANHASQANTTNQPLLVYPPVIGGQPSVRFNGIQDDVHGDYMSGTGNVGLPNAMTAFTVYNAFTTTNGVNVIQWLVGHPGLVYEASRANCFYYGDLAFQTWAYGYPTAWIPPPNTYRIWTDRVNTNLTTLEMFDNAPDSSTNFSAAMPAAIAPSAGYYVGGLNPALTYVHGYNYDGDIAELILYQGYLSDADRLAVLGYLQQKYSLSEVNNNVSYQWQFDGANIDGATNAVLTLSDAQTNESGSYSVVVTNLAGSATSSNAVLTVASVPSITVQPLSQEVAQGTNVSFTVTASGTAPLSYQWFLDGAPLAQATNSSLPLPHVQSANSGSYSVVVSSPFGSVLSSTAVLTIDLLPVIVAQPQSQSDVVGTNVTLSVTAAVMPSLPVVNTGALQLWLKADAGVITNSAGLVSQWQDQSGHTNHASQANTNNQPVLVYPPGLGGAAAVRFNGVLNAVNGDFLTGTGDVGLSNALTGFAVYNAFSNVLSGFDWGAEVWVVGSGSLNGLGDSRASAIWEGDMVFGFGSVNGSYTGNLAQSPFVIPTNTYRICTDRLNTNLSTLEMFDTSASSETNFSIAVSGLQTPAAGYSVGGLNPALQQYVNGRCFDGDIAEVIIYQGYLSDADRLEVANYLEQKYYQSISSGSLTYQWQFDGTNIDGATNATLTLTNLQGSESGTYSVIVTSPAGSVTSSNAILAPLFPPMITSSPSNQAVVAGTTVTFNASATGTAPLTYQWQFDGTNLSGATNTSLTVTNALRANAGSYLIVATSPYGSATSSVAVLSVDESTIQVVSTSAVGGGTVVVSIDLNAVGTETGLGFSLDFDPSVLNFTGVVLGTGAAGGTMVVNSNQAASGSLGILFGGTFSPGTNDAFDVTFQVEPVTNATATTLTFGNVPTGELVSDAQAQSLPAVFLPGVVLIPTTPLEGDMSPRPSGNEVVNLLDWVQEGRFVAGLDTVSNGSEFQRADCAPRATQGDGQITVADWVQVGRYAVGLDPLTAAGGPTNPISDMATPGRPVKTVFSSVMLVPLTQGALMNSVAVELAGQGGESALSFSVTFDPTMVRFVNASLGSGAPGATLIQNTNLAGSGALGFVAGLLAPGTFAAGTQPLVQLNFASVTYSNNAVLHFADAPVLRQLADSKANILSANYQDVTLAVGGSAWPALAISQVGSNVVLSWPSAAAALGLQVSSAPGANWSNVPAIPATIGNSLVVTSSISTNSEFYRLKH